MWRTHSCVPRRHSCRRLAPGPCAILRSNPSRRPYNCLYMERPAGPTQAKAYATLILLACCPCAFALNPSLDINQYAHTAWTIREGFFTGAINAITQTPDGYLWLGTEFGLLRFDGLQRVPWQPPAGEQLPSSNIRSLL